MINIEDIEVSFKFNPARMEYVKQINELLAEGKPFMIQHKNSVSVFIPQQLLSFYSGGGVEHDLNGQHVQRYASQKAMEVSIGMLIYSCKGVIGSGNLLSNKLKLIQQ